MIQRATINERGDAFIRSGPGTNFRVVGHQPYEAEGEVLETQPECDTMLAWYEIRFESFGGGSVTGWCRAHEVELLPGDPSIRLAATRQRISHDEPPVTRLDTPHQRRSNRDA